MPTACRQPTRLAALDSEQGFKGYLSVGLCASAAVHFLLSRGRAECPVLCLAFASVLGNASRDLHLANALRFLCTRDNTSIGCAENNRLPDRQDLRSIFRTSHKIFCYLASTHPLPCSFPLQHESIDSVIVSVTPSPPEYAARISESRAAFRRSRSFTAAALMLCVLLFPSSQMLVLWVLPLWFVHSKRSACALSRGAHSSALVRRSSSS